LRGDEVRVLLRHQPPPDPRIARAVATLRELGFDVRCPSDAAAIDGAVRAADKIEVWT
jgi:hypothetical protein